MYYRREILTYCNYEQILFTQDHGNKVAGCNPANHILGNPAVYSVLRLGISIQESNPERVNANGYEHKRKRYRQRVIYSSLCAQKLKFHLNSGYPETIKLVCQGCTIVTEIEDKR